jgi:hypothetical protein
MIADRIRINIKPNTVVPKPEATADFIVKGWGKRRSQPALIYRIPNHVDASRPYEKGVTEHEFEAAYNELMRSGFLTREWFNNALAACAKEGGCNFTTIGGVFQLLGIAEYSTRGSYARTKQTSRSI